MSSIHTTSEGRKRFTAMDLLVEISAGLLFV